MVGRRYASHVLDVRAKRGANVDSDHFLVVTKVRIKITHRNQRHRTTPAQKPWDTEKLRDVDTRTHLNVQ